jgi:hypothetical protein
MKREELVEAMARAMCPLLCGSQEDEWGGDLPDKQFDDLTPDWQKAHLVYAQAALAAYDAFLEARGLAVVPVVPTEGMLEAGDMGLSNAGVDNSTTEDAHFCYTAMLAAARGDQSIRRK